MNSNSRKTIGSKENLEENNIKNSFDLFVPNVKLIFLI